ncbi:MAG: hypothetical protein MZU79_02080 [Anaerotruncus sp.]|nr:hypothetical protein [Anaerotruncus sp.]
MLSKAYDEIEKLKKINNINDNLINNLISYAQKAQSQGKTQKARAIYGNTR